MAIDLVNVAAGAGGFVIHGQDADDHWPAVRYPRPATSTATASTTSSSGLSTATAPATPAPGAGDSYVVFGKASGFAAEIDLAAVAAGNGGFVIHGQDAGDQSGYSVSSAGDVNGDGFDDLIIGAPDGDGPGNTRDKAGDSYVVFGQAGGFAAEIDLAAVAAGNGGFVIHGAGRGRYIRPVGVLGRRRQRRRLRRPDHRGRGRRWPRQQHAPLRPATAMCVFGHAGGFAAEIDLAAVAAGNGGFVIHGQDAQ